MKICCLSDLHGHYPQIPECDLLLLGGDYCSGGNLINKLDHHRRFCAWIDSLPCKVVGIAGNHDILFESLGYREMQQCNWTYLQDSFCVWEGLKIYGTPWTRTFFNWAFMLPEHALSNKWEMIPQDADIIISHGPIYGIADRAPFTNENVGSPALRQKLLDVRPKLFVCGHIHSGYGKYELGETKIVSASLVNEQYRPVNPIQVIEI